MCFLTRLFNQGHCGPKPAVGDNQLRRCHVLGWKASLGENSRHLGRVHPLAQPANHVQRAWGQLAQHVDAVTQGFELIQHPVYFRHHGLAFRRFIQKVSDGLRMFLDNLRAGLASSFFITRFGLVGRVEQQVGHTTHGRHHHHNLVSFLSGVFDNFNHIFQGLHASHGSAAKFHYD